ncbi:MAG TPA: aspartate kinase [Longimicrobium sp.]|jgi:aspartate kinase
MALVVQKFGGTSVGSPERIQAVARRVARARRRGDDLVVVVSAMGHTTDELTELASRVTGLERAGSRHPREMDMLLTAGERIAAALLTMAIQQEGAEACSFTGSQAAIITDEQHTAARIREIRGDRVREALAEGMVAIVAGFQGVSTAREITTLGRGGSDTTAVALAAALKADRCEIFTDVPGVFTADPRRVPGARVIREISHAEMLEMASAGAQVMHARAVDIAARFGVDIRVLSSFSDDDTPSGTLITAMPRAMEDLLVTGLASAAGQVKLVLRGLPGGMASSTELLGALADGGVSVDMVSEADEGGGRMQVQLTVAGDALERARQVAGEVAERLGSGTVEVREGLTRITLVGSGMTGRPGVYARAYRTLHAAGVEVHGASTSSISVSLLVPAEREDDALRALHDAFALEMAGENTTVAER